MVLKMESVTAGKSWQQQAKRDDRSRKYVNLCTQEVEGEQKVQRYKLKGYFDSMSISRIIAAYSPQTFEPLNYEFWARFTVPRMYFLLWSGL